MRPAVMAAFILVAAAAIALVPRDAGVLPEFSIAGIGILALFPALLRHRVELIGSPGFVETGS